MMRYASLPTPISTYHIDFPSQTMDNARPFLMGKAAAVVNEKKSAKAVVDELVNDAAAWIHKGESMTVTKSKL